MTCTLKLNNSRQCMQFPFPAFPQPLLGLRLDFADTPANVVVLGMALRDAEQAVQWQWDGAPEVFADLADAHLTKGESDGPVVLLASHGLDPRCHLAIPAEMLARVQGGWRLELTVSPQTDPLHDLLRDSLSHQKQIIALSKLVVDQRQHIELLERACREQLQRIEQLAADSKLQQLTVARYEENDAIIRKKLAEQDSTLSAIVSNKWLRRLFSFKQMPSA
ncbi:hypothetical protein GJ700_33610 [Duganella sp. FT92W]|uniref:Uncharacterized protein n=1 Tax=Pseudoduganella rivuli TaxID=2666085 RepID=A0A7X2IV36_9BURK|nr:hypothetical protein [Pseudoduganella rivuli]MRV76662.1 hypothetical protein [Pseudoduganella rivuli]